MVRQWMFFGYCGGAAAWHWCTLFTLCTLHTLHTPGWCLSGCYCGGAAAWYCPSVGWRHAQSLSAVRRERCIGRCLCRAATRGSHAPIWICMHISIHAYKYRESILYRERRGGRGACVELPCMQAMHPDPYHIYVHIRV